MNQRLIIVGSVLLVVLLAVVFYCLKASNSSADLPPYLIDVTKELATLGIKKDDGNIIYDEQNIQWKIRHNGEEKPNFPKLEGKDYYTIIYEPKGLQFGGVVWLFVEKDTNNLLYVHREK